MKNTEFLLNNSYYSFFISNHMNYPEKKNEFRKKKAPGGRIQINPFRMISGKFAGTGLAGSSPGTIQARVCSP